MKFLRKNINTEKYYDNVFYASNLAKKDSQAINVTAGCLVDDDGKLFTYDTVFNNEANITNIQNASYAVPHGEPEFLKLISEYVLEGKVTNNYITLAAAGGTGTLFLSMRSCLDEGDQIIMPEICWGNYDIIVQELNLDVIKYDVYDINSLFEAIDKCKDKVFLVINSPCHNPCGQNYSLVEWKAIMNKLNSLDKEVVLLNDIAYIDYANDDAKEFFKLFNDINDNVLVTICYSCSKSFSYYGKRVGAFIAINNDEEFLENYESICGRIARTTWSNVNHGAMLNILSLLKNHHEEYVKERTKAKELLKKRSDIFVKEANEVNLPIYSYENGFFVTIKVEDQDKRDRVHYRLIDNHIYAAKVNKGIRIGICGLPTEKIKGFAKHIYEVTKDLY